ncbi:MAG: TlpA disulfide reductase family protein [Saprospiraceae bacterium]|nr:TlpA disulfide reductase family protein [Saprospiraceae bacterium]MDZ4702735.1 TlpA disulfide reductase family protein [Saprospiraceae bacterium]
MKVFGLSLIGLLFAFSPQKNETVTITCKVQNCGNILRVYQFDGVMFKEIQSVVAEIPDTYEFKIPKSEQKFYYIGNDPNQLLPIILGTENSISISGNCAAMRSAKVEGSKVNSGYELLKSEINQLRDRTNFFNQQLQNAEANSAEEKEYSGKLKTLDERKLFLLDSLKKANPFLGRVMALNTYLSYPHHGKAYPDEIAYFAGEYFRHADFKDAGYNKLPWVYEAFKSYTSTLVAVQVPPAQLRAYVEKSMETIPKGSDAHKMALSGVINILQQTENPEFIYFGEGFIAAFKTKDPGAVANMTQELDRKRAFVVGAVAPDFTQPTPDEKTKSLSSLRGKIVLVDFWASWCGPCRRDNPEVVKLYETYKDKGFDILGVSLDRDKERWLQAIQQDGLVWNHVSDLKGWQNDVAKRYGVSSIPHTVLVDREGRIIARGLRGPALAEKLKELFQ